ncbi:concanavalin A-like lectin/glucanase domain-containing protein, partial [Dimargaris cristalligena]
MHVAHAPKRHDFRMGFKRPFKINDEVPYWETHEDATVTDYFVRLSRNLPNHQGSIWSTISNPHREWEAHFTLHISGPGEAGSDGMAFWYTAHRGQSGPTYGNEDPFQGLGIIFHTYDENEKKSSPFVMAYLNDGHTKLHETNNLSDHMIGSCFRDVRRTTHLVHGRVTYQNRKLTFSLDTTSNGEKMIECFEKDGVDLPPNYYFGFTAASGPQPDDHDVNSFDLFELNPAPKI